MVESRISGRHTQLIWSSVFGTPATDTSEMMCLPKEDVNLGGGGVGRGGFVGYL